jgi:predicted nucleotidyltransferase
MTDSIHLARIELPADKIGDLCQRYLVREMALFGSVLRDDFNPDKSDIDVLVEFEPEAKIDLVDLSGLRLRLIALFGQEVDLVSKKNLKPFLKDEVLANMVVIFAA